MGKNAFLPLVFLMTAAPASGGWVDEPFSHWLETTLREPVTRGSAMRLYVDGPELFPALLDVIDQAKASVDVAMFLWCDDASGLEIADHLVAAAGRGVRVRVINDDFNAKPHARVYRTLRGTGLPVLKFNPPSWDLAAVNDRIHEKLVVADGNTIWVAGANFCDEYMVGGGKRGLWHELALVGRGPVAARAQAHYDETWDRLADKEYDARLGYATVNASSERAPTVPRIFPLLGATPIQPLDLSDATNNATSNPTNNPTNNNEPTMLQYQQTYLRPDDSRRYLKAYSELVRHAIRRVVVYEPYFTPHDEFGAALLETARRGVDVRLLTNSGPTNDDGLFARIAQRAHVDDALLAGVHVYEIAGRTLHAKALFVDDAVLVVGSHNFTHRAFSHNGEADIMTGHPDAVSRFRDLVADDLTHRAREITQAEVRAAGRRRTGLWRVWNAIVRWIGRAF